MILPGHSNSRYPGLSNCKKILFVISRKQGFILKSVLQLMGVHADGSSLFPGLRMLDPSTRPSSAWVELLLSNVSVKSSLNIYPNIPTPDFFEVGIFLFFRSPCRISKPYNPFCENEQRAQREERKKESEIMPGIMATSLALLAHALRSDQQQKYMKSYALLLHR